MIEYYNKWMGEFSCESRYYLNVTVFLVRIVHALLPYKEVAVPTF